MVTVKGLARLEYCRAARNCRGGATAVVGEALQKRDLGHVGDLSERRERALKVAAMGSDLRWGWLIPLMLPTAPFTLVMPRGGEMKLEVKAGAPTGFGLDAELGAHGLDQLAAEGQSESSAGERIPVTRG